MNVNEVLATRLRAAGRRARPERLVHPNDDVNMGQSSNDVFQPPCTSRRARGFTTISCRRTQALRDTLAQKRDAFAGLIKIGRTHLQDAERAFAGQEFSATSTSSSRRRQRCAQRCRGCAAWRSPAPPSAPG